MTIESPRALITGAGLRVGAQLARTMAKTGIAVCLHYRTSGAPAERIAQEISEAGGVAACVQADLADEDETARLMTDARQAIGGPINILINNASLFEDDSALDHSRAAWDRHFSVNLRAPILLSQQMAHSLPAEARGVIINAIDQRVWKLAPTFFTYTLSKSALWTATRTLAQALAPRIRVNAIGPGPTLRNHRQSPDDFAAQQRATLTGAGASPEAIAEAALYLINASAVTGQMIAVDGGQHLIWQTPDIDGIVE